MDKVSFEVFFSIWAERQRWIVPDIHWRVVRWLSAFNDVACLRCFRGFSKSTIMAIWVAYEVYRNPSIRILNQSESNPTAYKTSRDAMNVLRRHPLTSGILPERVGTVSQWWAIGATDSRNATMYSRGIMSNVTSARADLCINDDIEVKQNTTTPELRDKMRNRLGEQIFIMVPGSRQLFIGTPHTYDSIYEEIEGQGADCLTIPLFADSFRIDGNKRRERAFRLSFTPHIVLVGIGKHTKLLREGVDYQLQGNVITFAEPPTALTDIYGQSAWPERFDTDEIFKRRQRTRTINEWDSQYQLIARPINKVRLDPEKIREYDCELVFATRNRETVATLGNVRIISMSCYWDVSTGKRKADASAFSMMLTDERGHLYWHVCEDLQGELAEFNDRGLIDGGQVWQIRALVRKYNITNVQVEVNGVGSFAGKLLKQALKGLHCGVTEVVVTTNKQQRILDAFEGPLSGNFLWAHTRTLDSEAYTQMRDFVPTVTDQPDDFIDSGAGAILATPIRIGNKQTASGRPVDSNWRANGGTYEVQTNY